MLGIPFGFAAFGVGEWAIHKYLLHGLGRGYHFHFADHHRAAHRNGGYDPAYEGPVWSSRTQVREAVGLAMIGLAHAPLLVVAPFYTSTIWYCLARYRRDHRRAHLDPAWARDHLPWHYDHHMGQQDKNFGVSWSWFDVLARTREVFVGSARERAHRAKQDDRAATASAGAALRAQRRSPLRRLIARTAMRSSVSEQLRAYGQ
jgi:hypothetical protein